VDGVVVGVHDADPFVESLDGRTLGEKDLLARDGRAKNVVAPGNRAIVDKVHDALGDHRLRRIDNDRELGVADIATGIDGQPAFRQCQGHW
jgi:hypothetical protein